ncbi:GDSL-type esterase/lipase family protein [Thalassotalea sp. PLHSN55]|uniref:GDSL-type esterase/lipase family protein n=1 Tax=Thalassotalea sp. PLHSN55 TaxID=3435888 RepID=UPI003F835B4F
MKKVIAFIFSTTLTLNILPTFFMAVMALTYANTVASAELIKLISSLNTADNPNYQYTGRIDFSDPKRPYLTWPGSSIKARFSGTELALTIDDDRGENYYNVIIDEQNRFPTVIGLKKGLHTYTIATGLTEGEHSVEIFKRTEGTEGGSYFLGLTPSSAEQKDNINAAQLLNKPPMLTRKIEFYGDSITSGMGNEAVYNLPDQNVSEKNHYLSYAAMASRMLNAEHHSISHSGIGVMHSWFDYIMPEYFNQLSAVGINDTLWDFSIWQPHVVVINLMQNDSWLVKSKKHVAVPPSEQEIIQHYFDFVQNIRRKYPKAYIVCALGSMNATQQGSQWPHYINAAVNQIKSIDPQANITYLFFDFNGYKKHPRVAQHHANAKKLAQLISEKMNWPLDLAAF